MVPAFILLGALPNIAHGAAPCAILPCPCAPPSLPASAQDTSTQVRGYEVRLSVGYACAAMLLEGKIVRSGI